MNLMLRRTGAMSVQQKEEKRKHDREVVKKILEKNEEFRTKTGFFDPLSIEVSKQDDKNKTVTKFGRTDGSGSQFRATQYDDKAKQLKIYPDEIIFKDIKENQTYEINVTVRNLTKTVKKIRVLQPTTSRFRCDYDLSGALAPGLSLELAVAFSTTTKGDFHDRIVILSDGDYKFEIPLHAYSPVASIIFEPFINLGFIKVNQEKRYKVKFKNEGSEEGKVELRYTDLPDFKIEPQPNFKIKPGKTAEVDFVYQPREAGIFRGIVEVYLDSQSFLNHIDVNATSVDFLKFIVDDEGNELSRVEFGDVFFGDKKEIKGFLVNNAPKPSKFRVNFIHGLHNSYDEKNNLKTPIEEGLQQTQRVMTITPNEGIIDTYSQIPITFSCNSKVLEDHVIWVRNNCFKKTKVEKKAPEPPVGRKGKIVAPPPDENLESDEKAKKNHEYTAMFNFEEGDESKLLMMTASCICPKVSFGEESNFNFGTIMANKKFSKQLEVSNMHSNMEVTVEFPNVSVFYVEPPLLHLKAGEKKLIKMYFYPRSLGKFTRKVNFLINGHYPVPITFTGMASEIAPKEKTNMGLLDVDFTNYNEQKYLKELSEKARPDYVGRDSLDEDLDGSDEDTKMRRTKAKMVSSVQPNPKLLKVVETTQESNLPHIPSNPNDTKNTDNYLMAQYNTKKATDYLTTMRQEREMMKKKGFIVGQNKMRNDRIKSYAGKGGGGGEGGPLSSYGRPDAKLDSPRMNIPLESDTLFVVKPIGHYEPYDMYDFSAHFSESYINPIPFTDKAESHAETRDITSELTGEELQKIQVSKPEIDFGSIFVKSTDHRYFTVKNDLRKPISVRIKHEGIKELEDSYLKAQIVPSNNTASFKITFSSYGEQSFERTISYLINERHQFKILVKAQVTAVILTLKKNEEDFQFEEESLDMKIVRDVVIVNNGNAAGQFSWNESKTGCFTVEPQTGSVPPRWTSTVKVTYTPSGTKLTEDEELIMKVTDGPYRTLNCKAILSEVKCEFNNPNVDFGTMCVNERRPMNTTLMNKLNKNFAVFSVDLSTLPEGLEISPLRDRIPPDEGVKFEMYYCNSKSVKLENKEIKVNLRGSQPAIMMISAETIVPKVNIKEEDFNFGEVTFGNTETLTMTLVNDSMIDVMLTLDLRENEHDPESEAFSKLEIRYMGDAEGEEDQVLEEKDLDDMAKPEFKAIKDMNQDEFGDESEVEEQGEKEQQHSEGSRFFIIKLKKKKSYEFELRFSPKLQKPYRFLLPIALAGFERGDKMEGLRRMVTCQGITPKLIMEPMNGEVIFEKKIITSMDAVIPQHASITFTNSHTTKPLHFRIDNSSIEKKDIFTVIPTHGTIDPQVPVTIKVSFKPTGNEKYEDELPLYLEDESKAYTTIRLRGEGAYPKLLFDRREVIMPVVPLGIESKCTFKIENEGYQNLMLKYQLAQDIGAINLKVDMPDGKTLNSSSNVLRVDLSFVYTKPISFTTKLIFEDEAKQTYPIFVSGTADNCLLTNFPFFQVHGDEYRFFAEQNKGIRLELEDHGVNSADSNDEKESPNQGSKNASMASKSAKSSVGFTPIPMSQLERSCNHCKMWLNNFVLSSDIENYPNEVIAANGQQIYELIAFLTKRNPPQMTKIDSTLKKSAKIDLLHKQYSDLLHFLKENGAMLNTIRPEYLLGHHDLLSFYKRNPNPCASPSANRITEKHFKYISMDAWTTLFYQILKIYYLCRISVKAFKAMKEMPVDRPLLPDVYTEINPVYSQAELILLRWVELGIEKIFPALTKIRVINFDENLTDGLGIGGLLQMYIGNTLKRLFTLKTSINSEEDKKNNIEKVKGALREYGITNMPEMFDFNKPSAREVMVYLVHLFQILPFFLPKAVLEFPCMLKGTCIRNVLLNNPSNKKITYGVRLDGGGTDFTIEKDQVEIDPKQTVPFSIKYTSRISKQIKARVTFRNKKDTGAQATPLVFDLVSEVNGRNNEDIIKVEEEVQLYESTTFEITVVNPYPQPVNFTIKVENIPVVLEDPNAKKRRVVTTRKKEDERVFLPAFFCKAENISIAKNGSAKLPIYYLPVTLEPHKCHIIFTDERVGEMQYEVQGEPHPPSPVENKPLKIVCPLDNMEVQLIDIARRNQKMDYAITKLKDRIKESKSLVNKAELLKKVDALKENLTFYVECDQPFVQVPGVFTIQPMKKEASGANVHDQSKIDKEKTETNNFSQTDHSNKLPVTLAYKFPVQNQAATIMMRNGTRTDVRIFNLEITVMPKKVKALLEMVTPARIPLVQNIPIINTLDTDVQVKMSVERIKNAEAFKLPFPDGHTIKVGKEPYQLKLTFEPEWTHECQAKLTLFNKDTNEHFEYDIRGVGEEPLAEKEYVVECKLNKEKKLEIELDHNRKQNTIYSVEVDVPQADGPKTMEVVSGRQGKYPLTISPSIGGEFTGSVTFRAENDMYWWYMVTLKVESSKFERRLEIVSIVRKTIVQEIEIENPLNEAITFKVAIENDSLSGAQSAFVPARGKLKYQLTFLPLSEFRERTTVTFMNQKIGDIIYEIQLVSEATPLMKIGPIRCEIGKAEKAKIRLENVIKEPAKVYARSVESHNFYLTQDQLSIPPMGSAEFEVNYIPSELDKQDSVMITFDSKEIGSWVYKVIGIGVPPTKYPVTSIAGSLGKQTTNTITFKNPFREAIAVNVMIEADEKNKDMFELAMKKNKLHVPAQQTVDINYTFFPQEITDYNMEIVIQMNDKISWRYPVVAYTEYIDNTSELAFRTKCHVKLEEEHQFGLPGITKIDPDEDFSVEFDVNNREIAPVMGKWFDIVPIIKNITKADDKIKVLFKFTPQKPFKSFGEIIINKKSGGRWR